jgi:hypothetical protein
MMQGEGSSPMSGEEVALRRELEACQVRLRLLNSLEGRSRSESFMRELLEHRADVEHRLGQLDSGDDRRVAAISGEFGSRPLAEHRPT